ncbi:hypothetical protein Sjap_019200 [Stephania japonica]|uniref:Uncharacterized protein n=1 Tax=Stephania japonica TaxID=461633 RepID=A0AAP0EYC7_9MAGN
MVGIRRSKKRGSCAFHQTSLASTSSSSSSSSNLGGMASTSSNAEISETRITIEGDGVVASLEAKLLQEEHRSMSRKGGCIFKTPAIFRDINEKAFTPQLVSIGPYHRNKLQQYEVTEKYKVPI